MLLSELLAGLDRLIPFRYAETWDKVGLQIGDSGRSVQRVAIALDLTAEAIAFAQANGADLLICHHPPIFSPLNGLRFDQPAEQLPCQALLANLAVVALHTNLDAVPGGVADQFSRLLGLEDVQTFVPLIAAGERPESVWSDDFPLTPGFGRTGLLPEPLSLSELVARLRWLLDSPYVMVAAATDHPISRTTICPGSFDGDWLPLLRERSSDVLIVGEIKYHDRLLATAAGTTVIEVGHDVSERVVLQPLADLLVKTWPELAFAVGPSFDYNKMAF